MLEGKLLTYQLIGKNWNSDASGKKKGPVVALVDTSVSMRGSPEILAKSRTSGRYKKNVEGKQGC